MGDFSIFCVTVRKIGSEAYYSGIKTVLKLIFVKTLILVVMFTKQKVCSVIKYVRAEQRRFSCFVGDF